MEIPEFITVYFDGRLPMDCPTHVVRIQEYKSFCWGEGLMGVLEVEDKSTGRTATTETLLLRGDDLGVDQDVLMMALDAWTKRLRTTPPETLLDRPEQLSPWAEQSPEEREAAFQAFRDSVFPEPDDERQARREAALLEARADAEKLGAHIEAVWGLQAPPLHFLWGFMSRLREFPSFFQDLPACWASGVFDRLQPDGWDLQVGEGLDERLHMRFRRDPPEFLTIATGNSDGLHFGLWFHDKDACAGVVANYARDSAETFFLGASTLAHFRHRWVYDPPPEDATGFAARVFLEELAWWEAREEEAGLSFVPLGAGMLLGGPTTAPAHDLDTSVDDRYRLYHDDAAGTRALIEAVSTDPLQALAIGRELHWLDADEHRDAAAELLLNAYEALGRKELAKIAAVHLQHRDLPSVDVLERLDGQP